MVVQLFNFAFLPDWPRVLAVLGGGLALVLAFALGGSLPLLRTRPAWALSDHWEKTSDTVVERDGSSCVKSGRDR